MMTWVSCVGQFPKCRYWSGKTDLMGATAGLPSSAVGHRALAFHSDLQGRDSLAQDEATG